MLVCFCCITFVAVINIIGDTLVDESVSLNDYCQFQCRATIAVHLLNTLNVTVFS